MLKGIEGVGKLGVRGRSPRQKLCFDSLSRTIQASAVCGIDSESHSASAGNFSAPGATCVGSFQFIEIRALKTMIQTTPEKETTFGVRYATWDTSLRVLILIPFWELF